MKVPYPLQNCPMYPINATRVFHTLLLHLFLTLTLSIIFSNGSPHLGSIADAHGMPPLLQNRVSRGPNSGEEALPSTNHKGARTIYHLKAPSYQHSRLTGASVQQPEAIDQSDSAYEFSARSTFTPFISARAISNLGRFFEHIRENVEALREKEIGGFGHGNVLGSRRAIDIGQPERRRDSEPIAPERSEERSMDGSLLWQPQYADHWHKTRNLRPEHQESISPPRHAGNSYNPKWLWTNMGLGK